MEAGSHHCHQTRYCCGINDRRGIGGLWKGMRRWVIWSSHHGAKALNVTDFDVGHAVGKWLWNVLRSISMVSELVIFF